MAQEEKNKQVIREFTRMFKNEHNVDGVGHLLDKGLGLYDRKKRGSTIFTV